MDDPNVIGRAPNVSALLGSAIGLEEQLSYRTRGVMLGLAVGNLLGIPVEGLGYGEIERLYPNGVRDIDPREAYCPLDDDLAQAVELGETLLEGGDYVGEFGERLVVWARENGRGMGVLTSRVISEFGMRASTTRRGAYRLRTESHCAQRGSDALRAGGPGPFSPAGDAR